MPIYSFVDEIDLHSKSWPWDIMLLINQVKETRFITLLMGEFGLTISTVIFGVIFFSIFSKRLYKLSRNPHIYSKRLNSSTARPTTLFFSIFW